MLGQLLENTREALKGAHSLGSPVNEPKDVDEDETEAVNPLPSSEDEDDCYEECEGEEGIDGEPETTE